MADLLNVGTSALLSLQRAIGTVGNNIANVNTEGYSRQRVNFGSLPAQFNGGSYIGTGVGTNSVTRSYDEFLVSEVRTRTSSQSEFESFYQLSSRMDALLADPAVGLSPALESFFSSVNSVANNPSSLPERQAMLGEAQGLADRFHYLDDSFRNLGAEVNSRIESAVGEANSLASRIAALNDEVVRASVRSGGEPPNDLLDARDQLINELSKVVSVTTVEQSNGAVNVMVGKGQPLVVGFTAEQLVTAPDPFDSEGLLVGTSNPAGGIVDLSRFLSGGSLGAALGFRDKVLEPAQNQLGLLATGVAATFNEQHQLGLDLNDQFGGDFFQASSGSFTPDPANSGTASLAVDISDATSLTGNDYSLRFSSGQWTLQNEANGTTQVGTGPFVVDGLTINISGAASEGDNFVIQPTRLGATEFDVAINRAEDIAAAAPLLSALEPNNVGSMQIENLRVTNTSSLPLSGQVSLTFDPDALGVGVPGFVLTGIAGGPLAYDPATQGNGAVLSLPGIEFTVSGQPQAGDQINLSDNVGGSGDNRNALLLAGLQTSRPLLSGNASYQETYGQLVAGVAVQSRQAETAASTESVLLEQAKGARESVSGVNLDEEAADLIRFQQAYQAAAQMISVADELFQTLLNATRR